MLFCNSDSVSLLCTYVFYQIATHGDPMAIHVKIDRGKNRLSLKGNFVSLCDLGYRRCLVYYTSPSRYLNHMFR